MTAKKEIRLCMIGAGGHATRNVYPCFAKLRGVVVTANADLDLGKARLRARQFGIATSYDDYHEMLDAEKPDGVVVCVSAAFHAAAAAEIMGLGYHVYTEKPPGETLDQCRPVVAARQQTGKICMAALKKRYAPAYVKAKALLNDPRYGETAMISIMRTSGPYHGKEHYLFHSSIHVIDLAVFLGGEIEAVTTVRGPGNTYSLALCYKNGASGSMALTDQMTYKRGWEDVTAITTKGLCVQVDNSVEMLAFHGDQPVGAHKPEFVAGNSHSSVEMGFVPELQDFADCIREGREPVASIQKVSHSMAVIEAAVRSAETGKPENVEEL